MRSAWARTPGGRGRSSTPPAIGVALVETAIEAARADHIVDPGNIARSIYVDTGDAGPGHVALTEERLLALVESGRSAADAFLADWDFARWLAENRPAARD